MRELAKDELAEHNGKNGALAFIACDGKIFDVSGSLLWKKGYHQVTHAAGLDLTDHLLLAPHGIEFLERFPVVGILIKA